VKRGDYLCGDGVLYCAPRTTAPGEQKMLKNPIIVRNSKVPAICSWVIEVYAITLFPFVFVRDEGDPDTITHETIHFKQYLETFIIGFLLIYLFDYIAGLIKYKNTAQAYYQIRFEQEAYNNDFEEDYPSERARFSWLKYRV